MIVDAMASEKDFKRIISKLKFYKQLSGGQIQLLLCLYHSIEKQTLLQEFDRQLIQLLKAQPTSIVLASLKNRIMLESNEYRLLLLKRTVFLLSTWGKGLPQADTTIVREIGKLALTDPNSEIRKTGVFLLVEHVIAADSDLTFV